MKAARQRPFGCAAAAEEAALSASISAPTRTASDRIGDYAWCFSELAPLADYVTVNVSSPNTPGLRGLQNKDELTKLLGIITNARAQLFDATPQTHGMRKPILLKIAPDLDLQALDEIAEVVRASGIEGLIVSNTTIARPPLKSRHAEQAGGLSGKPLMEPSTAGSGGNA